MHVGSPLAVGEKCLLRKPDMWSDRIVELRAIDNNVALVRIGNTSEIVPLAWLRRA